MWARKGSLILTKSQKKTSFIYDKKRRQICSLSGGKDSTALAIFLKDKIPNLEYVFMDTGSELKETYDYLEKLEKYLEKKIVRLNEKRSFEYLLENKYNNYLPSPMARWCTLDLKIRPYEKYIGDDPIESYMGIRADEHRKGYISNKKTISPRFPFKEEGIDLNGVNKILKDAGLGLPKYYEWRTRSGCYFCFFQRRIEWVGLLEKHPKLFQKAKDIEKRSYKGDGVKFSWVRGYPLEELEKDKEKIKERYYKRLNKVREQDKQMSFEDVARYVNDGENEDEPCVICDI